MNKIKKIVNSIIVFSLIFMPFVVKADSGLESNYESSGSVAGSVVSGAGQILPLFGEIFGATTTSEDYDTYHVIMDIICILTVFIVTTIYVFKLNKKKKTLPKLGISLIITILFSLVCILTKLDLVIYFLILLLYIIPFIIISKSKLKKRLNNNINKIKELDKNFNEESFSKDAFNIYSEVQYAWCDFNLDKIKNIISNEIYDEYAKKLDELKGKKRKNIMSDIELKSNKITEVSIENKTVNITCKMNVLCHDYIVDENDEVVKGKKDKKYDYIYILVFNKKNKSNSYVLVEKKLSKIK